MVQQDPLLIRVTGLLQGSRSVKSNGYGILNRYHNNKTMKLLLSDAYKPDYFFSSLADFGRKKKPEPNKKQGINKQETNKNQNLNQTLSRMQ